MAPKKSDEEYAVLEKLSAEYVPEQKGDLVGARISSRILMEEYAEADPIYASKTQSLPSTHPAYRPIKGDGNCGFRAIAFGYFEVLARLNNADKVRAEAARVESLNSLFDATGLDATIYESWVEETLELLEKTAAASPNDVPKLLLEAFNDSEKANAITQHFRLLTSVQLKLHPDDYAPFVPDLDVEAYCKVHIDPFQAEIDHIGIKGLVDALINKAGIAIGCLYLDRSEGSEATSYSFPVLDQEGKEIPEAPIIRLLYRPGHYDLLYTQEDLMYEHVDLPDSSQATMQVQALHDLPFPNLLDELDVDGLPGFDPNAHFEDLDPSMPFLASDGMPFDDYPADSNVLLDLPEHVPAFDQAQPTSPNNNIGRGQTLTQALPSGSQHPPPSSLSLSETLLQRVQGVTMETGGSMPESPSEVGPSGVRGPSETPAGQRQTLSWAPRSQFQMEYDNYTHLNGSLDEG